MKIRLIFAVALCAIVTSATANCFVLLERNLAWLILFIPLFLLENIFAGRLACRSSSRRLRICCHGGVLLAAFWVSLIFSVIFHVILAFRVIPDDYTIFIWSALLCVLFEAILFWNGIICVYLTSVQLGIKQRIIGVLCGMIPIANLIALWGILKTVFKEVSFEYKKECLNRERKSLEICKTKYPILMVHGVFFRDSKFFNYWGRIPGELTQNGAEIYYGNHQSAASVDDCGRELARRIREIVSERGCEKVNIIAHSKGGLDCRRAISDPEIASLVASLTTVSTPHRGCLFADYLLERASPALKNNVAGVYNSTLKKFGEENPDFLAAVNDLRAETCAKFDGETAAPAGVFCQSIGSVLPTAKGGQFPLNFSYHLVKHFDGENDGLVSEKSFEWGEKYILLRPKPGRGISHGDVIDLNRQNIDGFDVREFYVELVRDLRERGF